MSPIIAKVMMRAVVAVAEGFSGGTANGPVMYRLKQDKATRTR
jgi:hypothetical protein